MTDLAIDEAIRQAAPGLLEHINEHHDDSLLLVGRILGDRRDATAATATGVDPQGIDLLLSDGSVDHAVRVEFGEPVQDVGSVSAAALALVRRARELSGESGQTSIEREFDQLGAIRTFLTSVAAVADVHPRLRCITLAGGDLKTFETLGPDTFVYVLLPPPGRRDLTIDASFSWEQYGQLPPDEQPVGAYYTVRAWRPEASELELLFVLHEPAGPASAWAALAQPGDPVAIWGPREAFAPPAGTARHLLVADETGLPAVAAVLESLPADVPATVVAEADGLELRQPLPERPGDRVIWVDRDGRAPGTATELLVDAVRALGPLAEDTYVWGGGESRAMTAVRKHVRHQLGLRREQVTLVAYWRHAEDRTADDDDGDGDGEGDD